MASAQAQFRQCKGRRESQQQGDSTRSAGYKKAIAACSEEVRASEDRYKVFPRRRMRQQRRQLGQLAVRFLAP
jgi:hypothetical protein